MRNVRPSWVAVKVDPSSNNPQPKHATGPRGRAGTLSAEFSARIEGASVPFLRVDAIGAADGKTVQWDVVDVRTGRVVFSEKVTQ